jgi:hypothetical protein
MKRKLLLPLIALTLLASACKKGSSSSSANSNPYFKGSVGGSTFTADTVAAGHFSNGDYYEVVGFQKVNGDSLILAVAWPDTVQVGKPYTLVTASAELGYTNPVDDGTFTLSLLDVTNKRVSGSFSGVLYGQYYIDSITVNNAQFNANFLTY